MSQPICYNCRSRRTAILFQQPNGFRARVCLVCNYYATYSYPGRQKANKALKCFWAWYYEIEFGVPDPRAFMGLSPRPIDRAIALLEALSAFQSIAKLESSEKTDALCNLAARHRLKAGQIRDLYECWMVLQADLAIYGEATE